MFCGSFTTCGELMLVLGLLGLSQGVVIVLNAGLHAEAPGWQSLATFDVRAFNLLTLGLAVYIAQYLPTRRAGHT